MDTSDTATDHEEKARSHALAYRKPELKFKGSCYNCGATLQDPAKFCDEFCREDYLIRNPEKA